jgi:general stress protein 26
MSERLSPVTQKIMEDRFGCDTVIAVATVEDGRPYVRNVNSYYENGSFYIITYALSNKMRQIAGNPEVAVCGEWFTGHGIAENMGHILKEENEDIADKLRVVFDEWYGNGHIDESDSNTCILRIKLTEGDLADHGTWYHIDW